MGKTFFTDEYHSTILVILSLPTFMIVVVEQWSQK